MDFLESEIGIKLKGYLSSLVLFQLLASLVVIIIVKFYPMFVVKGFRWWSRTKSGYSSKDIEDKESKLRFSYIEKGSPSKCKHPFVFLHGVGDTKEGFCTAGLHFPKDIHSIALDLPGHGNSPEFPTTNITADLFVKYIKQFLDFTGLSKKKVHLAGHSMGGALTCLYATTYPEDVVSVTFVCPAGTIQEEKSVFEKLPPEEIMSLMVPKDVPTFKKFLAYLTYKPFKLPDFILSAIIEANKSKAEFIESLLRCGEEIRTLPQKKFPMITTPALCIWGEEDQLIHVSGAKFVKDSISKCNVHIIPKCGHAILLDNPREMAMDIIKFLYEIDSD